MCALVSLSEVLAALRDSRLAEPVYQFLVPHRERCGHWGLLGIRWCGPVARVLGMLASTTGRHAQASEYFAAALAIARRMNAHAWIAHITLSWAETARAPCDAHIAALLEEAETLAAELGMNGVLARAARCRAALDAPVPLETATPLAAGGRAQVPAVDYFRLARDGEVWLCECEGRSFRLRDTRGLQMLARLLSDPGNEIHVLDLMGPADADQPLDAGDSGELLDERARRDYRARMETLRSRLEDAEALHDDAAADAAREEIERLGEELSRAFGLDGRPRRAGSVAERARVNVQRRLKHAMDRIAKECPAAGRHLDWAVRTGTFCSYRPD
jgi:hypothetical protein